jgi:hypothetical protein
VIKNRVRYGFNILPAGPGGYPKFSVFIFSAHQKLAGPAQCDNVLYSITSNPSFSLTSTSRTAHTQAFKPEATSRRTHLRQKLESSCPAPRRRTTSSCRPAALPPQPPVAAALPPQPPAALPCSSSAYDCRSADPAPRRRTTAKVPSRQSATATPPARSEI